jgi:hypothetical protein
MFLSQPPWYVKPQRSESDTLMRSRILGKLLNAIQKGYIAEGTIKSLTSYFAVPKGTEDIRMVYDASVSGLNDCLWAPNFWLPSAEGLVKAISTELWMGDLDMGEQFLNFPMHPSLQHYCGIDLRPLLEPTSQKTIGGGGRATCWDFAHPLITQSRAHILLRSWCLEIIMTLTTHFAGSECSSTYQAQLGTKLTFYGFFWLLRRVCQRVSSDGMSMIFAA